MFCCAKRSGSGGSSTRGKPVRGGGPCPPLPGAATADQRTAAGHASSHTCCTRCGGQPGSSGRKGSLQRRQHDVLNWQSGGHNQCGVENLRSSSPLVSGSLRSPQLQGRQHRGHICRGACQINGAGRWCICRGPAAPVLHAGTCLQQPGGGHCLQAAGACGAAGALDQALEAWRAWGLISLPSNRMPLTIDSSCGPI